MGYKLYLERPYSPKPPLALTISVLCKSVPSPRGNSGGLAPSNIHMKLYKSVEFLPIFSVSSHPAPTHSPLLKTFWRRFWCKHTVSSHKRCVNICSFWSHKNLQTCPKSFIMSLPVVGHVALPSNTILKLPVAFIVVCAKSQYLGSFVNCHITSLVSPEGDKSTTNTL